MGTITNGEMLNALQPLIDAGQDGLPTSSIEVGANRNLVLTLKRYNLIHSIVRRDTSSSCFIDQSFARFLQDLVEFSPTIRISLANIYEAFKGSKHFANQTKLMHEYLIKKFFDDSSIEIGEGGFACKTDSIPEKELLEFLNEYRTVQSICDRFEMQKQPVENRLRQMIALGVIDFKIVDDNLVFFEV